MGGGPIVRKPLSVRAINRRTIDQRFALRFPRLAAWGRRLLVRLPPQSRIRQALVWRATRLGYEAFNRRDFDAVLINYGRDAEFYPPQVAAAGGLLESSYKGHAGFHRYFAEFLSVWGAYTAEPLELIDLGDRLLMLGELRGRGKASETSVRQPYAALLTVRDGEVTSQREYFDHGEALAAVGLPSST